MTIIRQQDLIDSVADALQFISYYHPLDFIHAVHEAYPVSYTHLTLPTICSV